MAMETFPIILEDANFITPRVRHLFFRRMDGKVLSYIPGQFISIHFTANDKALRRSYSIASMSQTEAKIEFAISYVPGGPASELLAALKPGAVLDCSGAYGRLILRDEPMRRCFLMATGTGVTPYRAMLPQIIEKLSQDQNLEIFILLGVQHRIDQLYVNDFLKYSEQHERLHFRVYHSRDSLTAPLPYEHKGYVQSIFDEVTMDPVGDVVYLCGNPSMIDASYDILKNLGFNAQQVRREKYVS